MDSETPARAAATEDAAARLARRIEAERELLRLSRQPVNDPVLTPTVIFILGAVASAAIVGALYFVLL